MKRTVWNQDWDFYKEGNEEKKIRVRLPHDAMLLEKRIPDLDEESATGGYPGGKYFYVKKFFCNASYAEQNLVLEFEGVYMNSTVYLNGERVGGWIYGYTSFYVDLTGKLRIGQENEIKVVVDNTQTPNTRWYSGSGIYRNVNLLTGGLEHILPGGVRVTTVSTNPAKIRVVTQAIKTSDTVVSAQICKNGTIVASAQGEFFEVEVPNAKLWNAETPELYELRVTLEKEGMLCDSETVRFGIRTLTWDATNGFQVNGNTVKLRGGCVHHDHGLLGACSYKKAECRRIKKLKGMGYNAIRCAHNPAGQDLLQACDELGMYVVEETFDQWTVPQTRYDYAQYFETEWKKDVNALVCKDYNHPAVIMYSIGNEVTDIGLPQGAEICKKLSNEFHRLDASRPITIAVSPLLTFLAGQMAQRSKMGVGAVSQPQQKQEKMVGSAQANNVATFLSKVESMITPEKLEEVIRNSIHCVDIVGYNYGEHLYEGTHQIAPGRVILSTETYPCKIGRNWPIIAEKSYLIGDFMWTAWDYLGEAGVGLPVYGMEKAPFTKPYPCLSAGCGSFDLTGFAESQAYYTSVVWGKYRRPYIGVRPVDHSGEAYTLGKWRLTDAVHSWSWTGQDGMAADIEVYSIGEEIELLQDGISLGRKQLTECRCFYQTEYRPGKLEAISYDKSGQEIARSELMSADSSLTLSLETEETTIQAGCDDFAYINILLTDDNGIVKMLCDREISVKVEGAGSLRAVGSGNPMTEESFFNGIYTTYYGRMQAIIQSGQQPGAIRISASAEGVKEKTIEIQSI